MRKTWIGGLIGTMLLVSAATASAQNTVCCFPKGCGPGKTAVPGATPAAAQCCTNPADPRTCTPAANAGWRCSDDVAGNAAAAPGRQAIAGCVDGEAGTCIGGAVVMGAPTGCISVGHQVFVTSSMPTGGATAEMCGHDAVDACCAHDACTSAPLAD